MKNSADLGECYPLRPSASVDNTLLDLQNSSYSNQPHSIIAKSLNDDLHRFNITLTVLSLYTPWSCNIDVLIQIILNKKSFDFLISGRHLKLTRE